ncbi:hypothetical protein [Amycolatopsis aidingensis]|uniref:hypothetical protein n=1 Tax=Amycolatopsis aidingensis TaxID=2842453 RepID=UPI001C0DB220|nr:hypothetical protein [Amycolatopsis aidingensis]
METWRVIATALLGVAGIIGTLIVLAKVRERTGSGGQVALSGAMCCSALGILAVLALTVLPAAVTWVIVGALAITVTVALAAS